jgi:hypothetical protein
VTIVTTQPAVGQVVAHNPYVKNILVAADVLDLADELRHIPVFDLVVVWKYLLSNILFLKARDSNVAAFDLSIPRLQV